MALRDIDKKVVDAFIDKKPMVGRILESDGQTLRGPFNFICARWIGDSWKMETNNNFSSKTDQSIYEYVMRTVPKKLIAPQRMSISSTMPLSTRLRRLAKILLNVVD